MKKTWIAKCLNWCQWLLTSFDTSNHSRSVSKLTFSEIFFSDFNILRLAGFIGNFSLSYLEKMENNIQLIWKNVTYADLLMHEFCWLKLGVSYFVMGNCIFIIGFGRITFQQKTSNLKISFWCRRLDQNTNKKIYKFCPRI